MRSRPNPAFIACFALLAGALGGCAAFNLGPQTEAAELANAQTAGYPRIVDVPPVPENLACGQGGDTTRFGDRCVANHAMTAAQMIQARQQLEQQADGIRAARPAEDRARIELPEDFGRVQEPVLEGGS